MRCSIRERIDRAESLRAEIPASQRHAALECLAICVQGAIASLKNSPVRLRSMADMHGMSAFELEGGWR